MAKARENMTKSIDSQERAPRIRASWRNTRGVQFYGNPVGKYHQKDSLGLKEEIPALLENDVI
jgi:hypothetical protein